MYTVDQFLFHATDLDGIRLRDYLSCRFWTVALKSFGDGSMDKALYVFLQVPYIHSALEHLLHCFRCFRAGGRRLRLRLLPMCGLSSS